ncbi:hypothetical protein EVAR_90686_1 [Eumeta japonica]|uniref:Uncharacterized protein n=1 Tax=Eumeta variegata TaxID=151549 RepID=A0A4C1Z0X8_EUMVA|nr:hypothetical protein EVAR_90686_1 [Eumeta japonica]
MAGDESDSDLKPSSVAIIREVYDSENAHLKFELELERALEAGKHVSKPHRAGRGKTLRAQMYACYLYGLTLPPDRTIISRTHLSIVITTQIFVQMM